MKSIVYIVSFVLALHLIAIPAMANEYSAVASIMPPYTICKGLRVKGIAVTVLSEIMKKTDTPFNPKKIKLLPWKKAVARAKAKPHLILLNVPRTPDLEKQFKWVGPMDTQRFIFVGKKDTSFSIASSMDATKYKTATIRNSAPEKKLFAGGIDAKQLQQNTTHVQALRGLDARAIDLFAHNDLTIAYLMTGLGIDTKGYSVVYTFFEEPLYYAFNKDTNDALITKLNTALSELKLRTANKPSRFDDIVAEYLPFGRLQ